MRGKIGVSAEINIDWLSRGLSFFTGQAFTHIYFVYRGKIYHCVEKGVCVEDYEEYMKHHYEVWSKSIQLECRPAEFFKWFAKYKGTPYSFGQYLGFAVPLLQSFSANGRNKAVCSEFIAWLLYDLAKMKQFKDGEFKTPGSIVKVLRKQKPKVAIS